jgi:hypothetical protein
MEHLSGENIMIVLLAGFSGLNLFFNYLNKRSEEFVEIKYSDNSRVLPSKAREQIQRTC